MKWLSAIEPENFDLCPILLAHPHIDPWTPLELSKNFYPTFRTSGVGNLNKTAGFSPVA